MAYTTIIFKNPKTDITREAPVGFSWTTFFFGFFPALFRKDWKWAAIQIVFQLLTFGVSVLVFSFKYNKLYIRDLINSGFQAESVGSGDISYASTKVGMQIPMLDAV